MNTRAFVGLFPAAAGRAELAQAQGQALAGCTSARQRVLAADTLHLTLAFLGSIDAATQTSVEHLLAELAARTRTVSAHTAGLVVLPPRRPRVIAFALESGGALEGLAAELRKRLGALGMQLERRAFVAHLSLARVRAPVTPGALPPPIGLRFPRLGLYASEPDSDGPHYRPLTEYALLR